MMLITTGTILISLLFWVIRIKPSDTFALTPNLKRYKIYNAKEFPIQLVVVLKITKNSI